MGHKFRRDMQKAVDSIMEDKTHSDKRKLFLVKQEIGDLYADNRNMREEITANNNLVNRLVRITTKLDLEIGVEI